ncbi:MAG: hypothetical protein R3253_05245 [Longimicrobiales bacterium]|nr:hypothetical protein [Longimicrobiales bacterium]
MTAIPGPTTIALGATAIAVGATPGGSQEAPPVLESVALSADSIEIGDRFDLTLTLRLPPTRVAFFPDSLAAPGIEPFQGVLWEAAPGDDGSTRLTVTYPLLAYRTGALTVPEIDLFLAPRSQAVAVGFAGSEGPVGSWEAFREAPGTLPSARLVTTPGQAVQVATVLGLDDITTQITPRPPADVLGPGRDWLSTTLMAFFGLFLVGVAGISIRDWLRYRARQPATPPLSPRERALAALDELATSGMHRDGRVRDFYLRWTEVVRRYVEGFADEWGPSWTSTELMSDLQGPRRGVAIERSLGPERISGSMRLAEEVKFGGARPAPETAEEHLQGAREWIAASTSGPESDEASEVR